MTLETTKSEGYSNYKIAEVLKRPLNSVMGKLYTERIVRLRDDRITWTPELTNKVKTLLLEHKTIEDISKILDIPPNKVFSKGTHLGFSSSDIMTDSKIRRKEAREKAEEINENKYKVKYEQTKQQLDLLTEEFKKFQKVVKKLLKDNSENIT